MSQISYRVAYDDFSLDIAAAVLSKGLVPGINACFECCDRHATVSPDRDALIYQSVSGKTRSITFGELQAQSARFAQVLVSQGIKPGDCIAGLLPRTPELLVTILGTWRVGAVYLPLFTAFGPKAIQHRLSSAGAKLVVTDADNRPKLNELEGDFRIINVSPEAGSGDLDFSAEIERAQAIFEPVLLSPDAPFMRMYTSGTTGAPKSLDVPLKAMVAFAGYMNDAVDMRPDDTFWNVADPGWAYGLYYAVTGPLLLGHSTIFFDGAFSADSAIDVIRELGVTNLAGSPSAYRIIIAAGPEAVAPIRGQLRAVSSAGEPLTPEIIRWFAEHLETTVHDHYGQTELGMVVANHHALAHPVRVGSAGLPVPGHRVVVLDDNGRELGPAEQGVMAIDRKRSPLFWFAGYREMAAGDEHYYLTGDTVEWGTDGSISFVGRADDVITSSGYRIGPFDVESALAEHPAVLECAVVGMPDPERTEIVKAFVVLKSGNAASPELAEDLKQLVRKRLSAHAYPREIDFLEELPKTPSGKIQRFLLRKKDTT